MHCSIMCGLWLCLTTITCRHYPNLLTYKCLSKWRGKQKSSLCHLNTECTATPRDSNHYFPDCHLKPGFTSPLKTCGAVLYFFRGHLLPACAHEVTLLYGLEDKACLLFSRSKKTALKPTRWLCRERYLTGKPADPGLMLGTQGGRIEPTPVLFITGPHPHTHGGGGDEERPPSLYLCYLNNEELRPEVVQWAIVFVFQASVPKFESPGPTFKARHGWECCNISPG